MNLFNLIGQIFKPAAELIDNLHTSEEEKLNKKAQLLELHTSVISEAIDYEAEQLKAKAEIVLAEAKSEHWLTSTWRPITMLTFVVLVVLDQTGLLAFRLAEDAWTLLQIGLGGYVVGRSAEKVIPATVKVLKSKEET